MSCKTKNFYEILDLKTDCSPEDIKKAFIKLSKEFHPDRNTSKDAHDRFVSINEAYTTLSNPAKRKLYNDHLLMKGSSDFQRTRTNTEYSYNYRSYDYTSSQYNKENNANKSFNGSRLLLRLVLLPKALIVTALVLMTLFSSSLEIYLLKRGFDSRKTMLDNESIKTSLMLERAMQQAAISGNEEQMRKLKEGKLGLHDDEDLVQAYIRAKESQRFRSK